MGPAARRPFGLGATGLGTLTLAGNKSYGGGTMVTTGTLMAGAAGAFGSGVADSTTPGDPPS